MGLNRDWHEGTDWAHAPSTLYFDRAQFRPGELELCAGPWCPGPSAGGALAEVTDA
jgi:hypothetical protein